MPRQNAGKKAYKLLDLLTGFYDPDVVAGLRPHGLNKGELEKGWGLLKEYGRVRRAAVAAKTEERWTSLDIWENRWFPVADVSLSVACPAAHDWLFHKLSRQHGIAVVLSVDIFVERVQQLEKGVRSLGADATRARQILVTRGLTKATLAEAEAMLVVMKRQPTVPPVTEADAIEAEAKAEAAMHAWYVEWSGIARAVLKEKRLLNHIGFGRVGRPKGSKQVKG